MTFSPAELSQPKIINIRKLFKNFLPVELAQPQTTNIPEIFKDFFASRIVLAANHRFTEIFKDFFACRVVLAENHQYPGTIQKRFACRIGLAANHPYPGIIQRPFRLQNSTRSKSSKSRKYSKTFSPAKLSQPKIINIRELFKNSFACRIGLAANHQYPGNIQRRFRCRVVLAENHQYPGTIQKLFCLQNWLSRKPPISRKYSKNFSPAELSQPHIIGFPK